MECWVKCFFFDLIDSRSVPSILLRCAIQANSAGSDQTVQLSHDLLYFCVHRCHSFFLVYTCLYINKYITNKILTIDSINYIKYALLDFFGRFIEIISD